MSTVTSNLFMYSLTLLPSTAITQAILGCFSGKKKDEQIAVASGSTITLLQVHSKLTTVSTLMSDNAFGIIRSMSAFRLAGTTKDYLIIGSDSGRLTVVEYIPEESRFQRVHLETFGKSGIRRVVPGEYLAVDPKGRACMIASIEKNKLVYVLARNISEKLTVSSPLEAHKAQTIVFSVIGLDNGYGNPIFASLEVDYTQSDADPSGDAYQATEKHIVYYELDLGLNHVVRRWSDRVDRTANKIFMVPGGNDGPSGVLICGLEDITWKHENQPAHRVVIPRRRGATQNPDRQRRIIAGVMHKMKGAFFALLQTEDGDLFKVFMRMNQDAAGNDTGAVRVLGIKYFDTVPPAVSLIIIRTGFLFVATESGDQYLYQFTDLLEEDDGTELFSDQFPVRPEMECTPAYFTPHTLANLVLKDQIEAISPLEKMRAFTLPREDVPSIFTISGTGAQSSLRMIKHGLLVGTPPGSSELPQIATAVFAVKWSREDVFDKYIVLSYKESTLVLEIVENGVEEAESTGLLTDVTTLALQQFGDNGLLQVYPRGVHYLREDGEKEQWPVPQHRTIIATATNNRQAAIALSSGEIVYFEESDGSLNMYGDRPTVRATVVSLALGDVPEGRQRSLFLAVACDDRTLRVYGLDPEEGIIEKSLQGLSAAPASVRIISMEDSSTGALTAYIHIGLTTGTYIRTVLEENGELSDTRTRFLGPSPTLLHQVKVKGQTAVLAINTKPWLGYNNPQTRAFTLTPLDCERFDVASALCSDALPESLVALRGRFLRIFEIEGSLAKNFQQTQIPLAYTPRDFAKHPKHPYFYVIESSYHTLSKVTRDKLQNDPSLVNGNLEELEPAQFGYPRGDHHWASCIQVVDPVGEKAVLHTIELEENETATCIAAVPFDSQDGDTFLVVGVVTDMQISPRTFTTGYINIYSFEEDGKRIKLEHTTDVKGVPQALAPFQGRVLAGVGRDIRIYDLGMKHVLRKCQATIAPNLITSVASMGDRIIVSDVREGVIYAVYKAQDNRIIPFADDTIARWGTCSTMVDYETVAGGDKFGNLWLVRCPPSASEAADEDGPGAHLLQRRSYLQGAADKLDLKIHYYSQDIPTSIQKIQLVAGAREVLLWAGIQGTIGLLVPFTSKDDVGFFTKLEMLMRDVDPPLAGRDHLIYRSYYATVKGTVDGDLCERYMLLSRDMKMGIAAELERSVREVEKKLQDMRVSMAY